MGVSFLHSFLHEQKSMAAGGMTSYINRLATGGMTSYVNRLAAGGMTSYVNRLAAGGMTSYINRLAAGGRTSRNNYHPRRRQGRPAAYASRSAPASMRKCRSA